MFTKLCTRMFPAALCILAKARNHPKSPIPAEWVNKQWSIPRKEQSGDEQSIATCNNMGDSQMYYQKDDSYCAIYRCQIIMFHT